MYGIIRNLLILILIIFKNKFTCKRIFQGKSIKKLRNEDYFWVNAASVGEVNLADTTIKKILNETEARILLTVMTDTGIETAKKRYEGNDKIDILFFPLDSKRVVKNIVKIINVRKLILVETEIWPHLIEVVSKKAEIIMINGRISDKSIKGYKKISWLLKKYLSKISYFLMQSEKDKERITALGAEKQKVIVTGNLKFDITTEKYSEEEKNEIRNKYFLNGKKVIVAGSTHPGEEEYWLKKTEKLENTVLFLVPRHINRASEIEEKYLKDKIEYCKWSSHSKSECRVILVDAMGVLRKLYSVCDYSFVGGTIANVGGHSLLEPMTYGKIPLFGKNYQNTRDIAEEILRRNIGILIDENSDISGVFSKADNIDKTEIKDFLKKTEMYLRKI